MHTLARGALVALMLAACGDGGGNGTPDANLVARGEYIVKHVSTCGDCHTPRDVDGQLIETMFLAGNPSFIPDPLLPTKNLTNHATGLANKTDEQIKNLIRNGTDNAGTVLAPVMPYPFFHNMTDADADAIVAYLRTVTGVDQTIPAKNAFWVLPSPAPAVDLNIAQIPAGTDASTNNGRYLATTLGNCLECHTPESSPGTFDFTRSFAGGRVFNLGPFSAESANLTVLNGPTVTAQMIHDEFTTGIAAGSVDDVICPPMPVGANLLGGMTTSDKMDIANYILSLPDIANTVNECTPPPPP